MEPLQPSNPKKKIITLAQYAMGRDEKFPEEWAESRPHAVILLQKVNAFLTEMFPEKTFTVSSGFRPVAVNKAIPNAATHSLHCLGKAIDVSDHDGFLLKHLDPDHNPAHAALLRKHDLFMERRSSTPTWCHLDFGDRPDRPTRTFNP